jgi:succinate dehydrogenase/fumarate reductase cytochrome b subunit
MQVKQRSNFWFLLPIVFNVIGGIIAFFIIKEDDPKKAKNCLYLGIILAAIPVLLIVVPILVGITLIPHVMPPISQNMHYV